MKEYNDKRFNLLIYGIPETKGWDKRNASIVLVRNFMCDALKHETWVLFRSLLHDAHRLPQ